MKNHDAELLAALIDEHLTSEDIVALARGTASEELARQAERHREMCPACDEEVAELVAFGRANVVPIRSRRPLWLAAAAAMLLFIAGTVLVNRQAPSPPAVMTTPATTVASETTPAEAPVATLRDQGRTIALFEDGRIDGVTVTGPEAAMLRDALTRGVSGVPRAMRALEQVAATTRSTAPRERFQLLSPIGTAVAEERPELRWQPLPGARTYIVTIFDRDFRPVAESEPVETTSWRPAKPLPRNMTLSWQVAAQTAEGESVAPAPEDGEARFRLLDGNALRELRAAEERWRGSHLLLGLTYARHGLLPEARRELEAVAKENPDTEVAKRLVDSVR